MILIFWSIFILVFGFGFLLALLIQWSNLANIRKNQETINNNANSMLASNNFNTSRKIILNDYATYNKEDSCKKFVAIDNQNKKMCFVDYLKGSLLIVDFNEILNYEIYENGSQQTFGGSAGGLWTGVFGAETEQKCKDLKLIIRINRYDISQICYEIIFNTLFNYGVSKSELSYKVCINTLQEFVSFLEVIKNENSKTKD